MTGASRHGRDGSGRTSFTLVEVLVVITIFLLVLGLITSSENRRNVRGNQVRAAVDQLVTTLRRCRQMAMEHKAIYGVTFNIANAAGSSGQVINNRGGGHWYRIIGPNDPGSAGWSGSGGYAMPVFNDRGEWGTSSNPQGTGDTELGWWLRYVQSAGIGPRYYLPKGVVRFVALTDEDNANVWEYYSRFPQTYPRPWFGTFQQTSWDSKPRLYCWGGYENDSNFRDFYQGVYWRSTRFDSTGQPVNYTGFYYQGDDPPIVGCVNPADRNIIDDPNGTSLTAQRNFTVLPQGQVRPLVNGDWLDCFLLFNPDGTAIMADWAAMRHQYGQTGFSGPGGCPWSDFYSPGQYNMPLLAVGDMCNCITGWHIGECAIPYNNRFEASNYVQATGCYYITLGPDMKDDTVYYSSAQEALDAMMPLYRVSISRLGEIKSFRVSATMPAGTVLDAKWQAPIYQTPSINCNGYWNNIALGTNGQRLVPATDFVTADMLQHQQWWIDE